MNNSQFRRLLLDNSATSKSSSSPSNSKTATSPTRKDVGSGGPTPGGSLLGSRMRSSIPMTPRSITGIDFARQLAESRRDFEPPTKKFKSSAAPKGTKLATGYQDRTQLRRGEEEEDEDVGEDKAKRIKALEEMVKLQQIDQATFEKLRDELGVGGDVGSTHLIKGLDWKLLRRVKAGEDVSTAQSKEDSEDTEKVGGQTGNVDEELDQVLEEKSNSEAPVAKEEKVKKGNMAPPPLLKDGTAKKRSRDDILRQLKASRAAATTTEESPEPPAPSLGSKFKKIGDSKDEKRRWIEKDESGRRREVLITMDEDGRTKRKVRWLDKPSSQHPNAEINGHGLLMPDKDIKPLGMEVPDEISNRAQALPGADEEDDDIFAGIGTEYNPLGNGADDSSSSASEGEEGEAKEDKPAPSEAATNGQSKHSPSTSAKPAASDTQITRNYFSTPSTTTDEQSTKSNPLSTDPTILAALKRAASLRQTTDDPSDDPSADSDTLRRKKFLEEAKKREREDAGDMDLGFGESRFGDDEEEERGVWEDGGGKKSGRKRGRKKRKGDKDSVGDVLGVLEGRRKKGEGGGGAAAK